MSSESKAPKYCAQQNLGLLPSLHFLKLTVIQYVPCLMRHDCSPATSGLLLPGALLQPLGTSLYHSLQPWGSVPNCSPIRTGDAPPPGLLNTL